MQIVDCPNPLDEIVFVHGTIDRRKFEKALAMAYSSDHVQFLIQDRRAKRITSSAIKWQNDSPDSKAVARMREKHKTIAVPTRVVQNNNHSIIFNLNSVCPSKD